MIGKNFCSFLPCPPDKCRFFTLRLIIAARLGRQGGKVDKEEGERRIKTYEDREHIGQNFPVLFLHTPLSTFLPCLLSSSIKPNCKKPTPVSPCPPASLLPLLAFTCHFRVDRLLVPQGGIIRGSREQKKFNFNRFVIR